MPNSDHSDACYNDNFRLSYLKFSKVIFRFLKGIIYDGDICEELSHDVFLKVYERSIHLDPHSRRTMNFLFAVAKNTAFDYLRRKKKEQEKLRALYFLKQITESGRYDVGNMYIKGEIVSTLCDTINSIPENKRSVFIEKNFYNRSSASIAGDAHVSPYRIKQINDEMEQKIRDNLKHYFEEEG